MEKWFQKGEYPIRQVIYCSLDSVTGSLYTPLLKSKYGTVDIVHHIRESSTETDLQVLLRTENIVVTTCWPLSRLLNVLPAYAVARGWNDSEVRAYEMIPRGYNALGRL